MEAKTEILPESQPPQETPAFSIHSAAYRQSIGIHLARADSCENAFKELMAHAKKSSQVIFQKNPMAWIIESHAMTLRALAQVIRTESFLLRETAFILDELLVAKGEPRAVELQPVDHSNGGPPS